jgi:hypothetical protein
MDTFANTIERRQALTESVSTSVELSLSPKTPAFDKAINKTTNPKITPVIM